MRLAVGRWRGRNLKDGGKETDDERNDGIEEMRDPAHSKHLSMPMPKQDRNEHVSESGHGT